MKRRTFLTLAALAGGAYVTDLASQLGDTPPPTYMRTGRVIELLGASQVVVDLGGGQQVDMPALTQYEPILGDVVQIAQTGAVQFVLGRTAPISGDNALANPSFELDNAGTTPPSHWAKVIASGTFGDADPTVDTASGWGSVTGTKWCELNSLLAGHAVIHTVSEAIPVQPGELWTAAGYSVNISSDTDGGTSEIALSWYGDATSMYPTTAAADSDIATISFPVQGMPTWTLLREIAGQGKVVPVGVRYMRVVLTSFIRGGVGSSAYWDAIICRKLRGV